VALALDNDLASVQLDDVANDGEAQAEPPRRRMEPSAR
jgi:hypothetical protein